MSKKSKLLLVLLPLLVFVMGIAGGVAYALVTGTQTTTNHGFKVSIEGALNVHATVTGKSYNPGSTTALETVTASFDGTQDTEDEMTKAANFSQALSIVNVGDEASFVFEIANTVPAEEVNYTDLIVKAGYTAGNTADNVVVTVSYSTDDGASYQTLSADEYLTVAKGDSVLVKVAISITERVSDIEFSGALNIALYTEDGAPEDYTKGA